MNATIKTLNETIKLLLQRDVISAPQGNNPPVQEEAKQTQETFYQMKPKAKMTVKSFKTCVCRLFASNAANKDIIKAIMLSNFDAHKASDLADNQIALCACNDYQATKD